MLKFMGKLLLLNQLVLTVSIIVQPHGPTHRNLAVKCIDQITRKAYNFTKSKTSYYTQYLLTYIVTKHLNTPGYEIQDEVLRSLHKQGAWAIEALQYGRKDFSSYSENCIKDNNSTQPVDATDCVRKHVVQLKSHLYIIIVEDLEMFYKKLDHLTKTSSYNSEAIYIIYYTKLISNRYDVVKQVINAMYKIFIKNIAFVIPRNITTFSIYSSSVINIEGGECFAELETKMTDECIKGKLKNQQGTSMFEELETQNYHQCEMPVHAMPYAPFVIDKTSGMEIDILQEIGKMSNISFRIHTYPVATVNLGEKNENGTWVGFLQPIYQNWELGIGNIPLEKELIPDFTYSVGYYWVNLVFVVPNAALVPRWRVLLIIFSVEMWAICLAVIFGFATAFYIFKKRGEDKSFRSFEKCVESSYQVFIAYPVPIQPISNCTRVYFIALAVFGIIINSVYISSLIHYLQTPIRDSQIMSGREIAEKNLTLGGSTKYKQMFEASDSIFATMILKNYQTVNDSLDTYSYWLKKVTWERNISTIGVDLNVEYLLTNRSRLVTDRHGDPRIFVVPKPLRTQGIGIIMRKGNFMERIVNKIIQRLIVEAGIIEKIERNYVRLSPGASELTDSTDAEEEENDIPGVHALTSHHLEGAFAILALGQAFGCVAFILELVYYKIKKSYGKKAN